MLRARNLDDQTYEEIVQAAEGRLPWLCPVWTDHNAHDPGITILELMAWYKELQQYHMNQFTPELRRKLLKLAGMFPRPASPAKCMVELEADAPERLMGARLITREGIPFELVEAVPGRRPVIAQVYVAQGERKRAVGELLGNQAVTFRPFAAAAGEPSALYIGFSQLGEGDLRVWFDVVPAEGVARNPFAAPEQTPRVICWNCLGAEDTKVVRDDTHALSVSGYVVLRAEKPWPRGEDGLFWLTLTLEDPGCEEEVRLSGISAGRYSLLQQETWACTHSFQAPGQANWVTRLADAQAREADLAVFLRRSGGSWEQTGQWQAAADQDGRLLQVDTTGAAQDGADNVMVITLDPVHSGQLLFDAKGLPGETFPLNLEGRTVLTQSFALLCNTLDRDGQIHPALWRYTEDLYACGPRDRVFTYDPVRETITFGDGEHGALLCRGQGAVLAAELVLSYCDGGNIPGGENLSFVEDDMRVHNWDAAGGAAQETEGQAQARLLRMLNCTQKCISASDYERLAQETPGLRVAAAKALPAFDPDEPTGVSRLPTVTVVVVPGGAGERPLPDQRFLEAVQAHLDRVRPIGTRVKVIPPVYVELTASVSLRGSEDGIERALREELCAFFEKNGIGGTLRAGDVAACVQAVPGVLQVREVDLHAVSPGCYQNAEGDIRLPRQAIPRLKTLQVERLPVERIGH